MQHLLAHLSLQSFSALSRLCVTLVVSSLAVNAHATTTETVLTNGLKVIIKEDHRSPVVMSQIWYKVGSSDESGRTLGISHVLEHMMFKGTAKVPHDEFTRLSRQFGGRINASTFFNYTNYYQLYPTAYFPLALELEADRMSNLQLRQQDLEPEVRVVMEERRQRTDDNPRALAFERFKQMTYPTSPYRQPVIGTMDTLQNIRLKDVQDWYKMWYRPNNAILVIVGDVKAQDAILQVQKYFGDIPAGDLPQRQSVTERRELSYRHMDLQMNVQTPNLYMAWNVPSLNTADHPKDAYTLNILRSLLDGGTASRLQARLVKEQQILTAVNVSYDPYNRGDSLFSLSAVPHSGVSFAQAQAAIEQEIALIAKEAVKQSEIDRFTTRFIANSTYSQDDMSNQANLIGNFEVNGLSHRLIAQLPQHYLSITPADVQRVAQQYLTRTRLSTMYLSPENTAP